MAIPVIAGALGAIMTLSYFYPPARRMVEQISNKQLPNALPDPYTIAEWYAGHVINPELFEEYMQMLGFAKDIQHNYEEGSKSRLSPMDYISAWRRGIISEKILDLQLQRLKFDKKTQTIMKKVSQYFPNPQDLVRFAVREVYSPTVVEKFEMDADYPKEFEREGWKAGLTPEQAKNYWRAHWVLPSINQGFEMLHRKVIKPEELDTLLRTLDVMPFWRDKLTQISYQPLTRVDVRRMFGIGVLDRAGVLKAYQDIGYDEKNAELMTQFTINYENDEFKGLTRATIINAYKDDIISKEQLKSYLEGFRYSPEVVQFWIDSAEYEKTFETVKIYADDLAERYKIGDITIEEMRNLLQDMDLPANYVNAVIEKTVRIKARRTSVPSKIDLTRWLNEGYIDEQYYVKKMRAIGYKDEDIILYLTEIADKQDTALRKFLKIDVYVRWMKTDIMSISDFRDTLEAMKISQEDILNYLAEAGKI